MRLCTLPVDLTGGQGGKFGIHRHRDALAVSRQLPAVEVVGEGSHRGRDVRADRDIQHDLVARAGVPADDLSRAAADQQHEAPDDSEYDQRFCADRALAPSTRLGAQAAQNGHGVPRSEATAQVGAGQAILSKYGTPDRKSATWYK